jgi:tetraacyldisaccharide 4'-kinase
MNPLKPLAYLYGKITQWRNQLYDSKKRVSIQFNLPIIAVGNLNTGGTGKTPHVAYLVAYLQQQNYHTAVLSRGYKRRTTGFVLADHNSTAHDIGDEPAQLQKKFPQLTVAVAENRALGIPMLLHTAATEPQVIILDDAFQHRSVQPQLSILLTEYDRPYTRDQLLPIGRLREPIAGAARADIIIVSKSPATLHDTDKQKMIAELQALPHQTVLFSHLVYGDIYPLPFSQPINLAEIDQQEIGVLLLCGIAQTEAIEQYVRSQYAQVSTLYFADHHRYTTQNLQQIKQKYDQLPTQQKIVLTTEKDATRLQLLETDITRLQLPIYCLPVKVQFNPSDTQLLQQKINNCLAFSS